jgi:hypothetical protein
MNDEDLEMIELLQRSCESKLVTESHLVEQRLARFARHGAPIVHRRRIQRIVVLASTLVLGTAGTATGALNGIRIGGVKLSFSQSSTSPSSTSPSSALPPSALPTIGSQSTNSPAPSVASPAVLGSDGVTVMLPGSESQWPGEPVTLEEAKDRYKARVRLPLLLKGPSSVFWLVPPSSGQVTAVWKPQKDLPKTDDPRVGLLFTQFRGVATSRPIMTKGQASSQGAPRLEQLKVKNSTAWFISGAKHAVVINDDSGIRIDTARLAANTLLWTSGEFTYRMEGNFTRAVALRLANSVP